MSTSLCFSGAGVPLGVVPGGVRMEVRAVCLQKECGSRKEQAEMKNDVCMVVLLTAKCVQVCVSVCMCVYMRKTEQGIRARSNFCKVCSR